MISLPAGRRLEDLDAAADDHHERVGRIALGEDQLAAFVRFDARHRRDTRAQRPARGAGKTGCGEAVRRPEPTRRNDSRATEEATFELERARKEDVVFRMAMGDEIAIQLRERRPCSGAIQADS